MPVRALVSSDPEIMQILSVVISRLNRVKVVKKPLILLMYHATSVLGAPKACRLSAQTCNGCPADGFARSAGVWPPHPSCASPCQQSRAMCGHHCEPASETPRASSCICILHLIVFERELSNFSCWACPFIHSLPNQSVPFAHHKGKLFLQKLQSLCDVNPVYDGVQSM